MTASLVKQPTPGFRILRAVDGIHRDRWAAHLANVQSTATLLKRDGPDSAWSTRIDDIPVVCKIHKLRGIADQAKSFVGGSRLARQWRGSTLLRAAGIPAARCLLLARSAGQEILVLEHLSGPSLLHMIASQRTTPALARAAGKLVARTIRAGLFNRDQKPSNIIVPQHNALGATLAVIDTVGVRRVRHWSNEFTIRMLASLVIEPAGTGITIPRTTMMRALCEVERDPQRRHTLWRAVARAVQDHGDPTPTINPLHTVTK